MMFDGLHAASTLDLSLDSFYSVLGRHFFTVLIEPTLGSILSLLSK